MKKEDRIYIVSSTEKFWAGEKNNQATFYKLSNEEEVLKMNDEKPYYHFWNPFKNTHYKAVMTKQENAYGKFEIDYLVLIDLNQNKVSA